MSEMKFNKEPEFSNIEKAFPDFKDSVENVVSQDTVPFSSRVTLGPNGSDSADMTVTVTDQNGNPVQGVPVTFSVEAVFPTGWWRDINQVKQRYGSSSGWKRKRLIGTVSPVTVNTNSSGQATTRYTSSHIGGDNPNRKGEEKITAKLSNGSTQTSIVYLGYTNLRKVKEIAGGLVFKSGTNGRWAHKELAGFLENLGRAIKDAGWKRPLVLTDIAYPWGGMIPPHSGHMHGLSIDTRPMSTDGGGTWAGKKTCPKTSDKASNYDRQSTKIISKVFSDSGATKFFFNDKDVTQSTCYPYHHHHLHVSWLAKSLSLLEYDEYHPVEDDEYFDDPYTPFERTEQMNIEDEIVPVEKPAQSDSPRFEIGIELVEVDNLIRATEARNKFRVSGKGLTVAVCDTGLNSAHVDFENRVHKQVNYTSDNNGDLDNAADGNGHGTNVGGIIVANKDHIGIAPEAGIVPIKVLSNSGGGSFDAVKKALQWVNDNHQQYDISVVCMSLGGSQNFQSDDFMSSNEVKKEIQKLKDKKIAVVIAAGNDFYAHDSGEGMSFPAIIRECVSVGAVYDNVEGSFSYQSGAVAYSTAPDRITPFSQRLHPSTHSDCFTDVFAPGAPVTSSGINGPHGESVQHGTSQATPVTCGVILLAQELYKTLTGELPNVDDLIDWIRISGIAIHDGDDESDNVTNTNKEYIRVDAVELLAQIRRFIEVDTLIKANILQRAK